MEAVAQNTNPNLTVGEKMEKTVEATIPTQKGLVPYEDENVTDTMAVNETELTDFQKQQQINEVANDSLFDGNGYTKSNGNGEITETDEIDTTNAVVVDESKVDELLPIEKLNQKNDLSDLTPNEKTLRQTLLEDLEKAQFYTVVALYQYVKVGKKLIEIYNLRKDKPKSFKRIIESVGLNERTAYRYKKIAEDQRFVSMTESQFKSLHHLTQSKMLMMTEFKDDKFYEAINDEDFVFPKKQRSFTMGDDIQFGEELFKTFKEKPKDYIINEYNELYIQFIELENKVKELEAK